MSTSNCTTLSNNINDLTSDDDFLVVANTEFKDENDNSCIATICTTTTNNKVVTYTNANKRKYDDLNAVETLINFRKQPRVDDSDCVFQYTSLGYLKNINRSSVTTNTHDKNNNLLMVNYFKPLANISDWAVYYDANVTALNTRCTRFIGNELIRNFLINVYYKYFSPENIKFILVTPLQYTLINNNGSKIALKLIDNRAVAFHPIVSTGIYNSYVVYTIIDGKEYIRVTNPNLSIDWSSFVLRFRIANKTYEAMSKNVRVPFLSIEFSDNKFKLRYIYGGKSIYLYFNDYELPNPFTNPEVFEIKPMVFDLSKLMEIRFTNINCISKEGYVKELRVRLSDQKIFDGHKKNYYMKAYSVTTTIPPCGKAYHGHTDIHINEKNNMSLGNIHLTWSKNN